MGTTGSDDDDDDTTTGSDDDDDGTTAGEDDDEKDPLKKKLAETKKSIDNIKSDVDKGISTAAPSAAKETKGDAADGTLKRIQDKIVQLAQGGDSPAVAKHLEEIDTKLEDIEERLSKLESEETTPAG